VIYSQLRLKPISPMRIISLVGSAPPSLGFISHPPHQIAGSPAAARANRLSRMPAAQSRVAIIIFIIFQIEEESLPHCHHSIASSQLLLDMLDLRVGITPTRLINPLDMHGSGWRQQNPLPSPPLHFSSIKSFVSSDKNFSPIWE